MPSSRAPLEDSGIPLDDPDEALDTMDAAPDAEPSPEATDTPVPEGSGEEVDIALEAPPETDDTGVTAAGGAITGKYNSSPVGDIKMTKVAKSYNTYKLELSMGQLEVIRTALEAKHDDPVSDELLATLTYYMERLPGPGEEEETKQNKGGEDTETDSPIPLPSGASAAPAPGADTQKLPPPPAPAAEAPSPKEKLKGDKPGKPGKAEKPEGKPSFGLPDFDEGEDLPAPPAE